MFNLFPDQQDELLDAASLPDTTQTCLNYRTRPLTAWQETRLTLLMVIGTTPVGLALALPFWTFCQSHPFAEQSLFVVWVMLLGWMLLRVLTHAFRWWEVVATCIYSGAFLCASLWDVVVQLDVWCWRLSLLLVWVVGGIVGQQICAWILAAPTVDYETGQRWKFNLPGCLLLRYSLDCPEILVPGISLLLIGPIWLSAMLLAEFSTGHAWYWPVFFPAATYLVWLAMHICLLPLMPFPHPLKVARISWKAIVVFLTYDIHFSPAAGIFRFPARWLRPPLMRWMLLIMTLVLASFSFATSLPQLPIVVEAGGNWFGQMAINYVLASLSGPVVFFSVLWFSQGAVLARFDQELEQLSDPETSPWDNYVDRIVNSTDEREREHILLGTTEKGDYPVLVDRSIYEQHVHVLGDSGSSKTALHIAPQVTQLIARGDSTVVVIDLKGDAALFQSCLQESKRAGLRFRWLSNEVGKSTFGFNPFLQSHNENLSVEQLTQQLLQGMSLDYGIEYGAGYFTAMNEIVLKNVLQEGGDRSFKELNRHLSDREWYGKIGHKDDWSQARHLAALVSRLAASESLNIVPESFVDQPEVHENALDAAEIMSNPQVVYLHLRSPLEPTNAPAIARLFLWCLFNAASQRPQDANRAYLFIDEIQQVVSDGIKLIFEQFRDLGGTIIAAHQSSGQLQKNGSDLGDTIDSCTAVKQVFRASNLRAVETLEKMSGTRAEMNPTWYQTYERGFGDLLNRYHPMHAAENQVRLSEKESPRLSRKEILEVGSRKHSSLLRFTHGSGYTQFAGATVPIVSQFHISYEVYKRRRQRPWPEHPGAFTIQSNAKTQVAGSPQKSQDIQQEDFAALFDQRARQALADQRTD